MVLGEVVHGNACHAFALHVLGHSLHRRDTHEHDGFGFAHSHFGLGCFIESHRVIRSIEAVHEFCVREVAFIATSNACVARAEALGTSKGLTVKEHHRSKEILVHAGSGNSIKRFLHRVCTLVRNEAAFAFVHKVSHEHIHVSGAVQGFGLVGIHAQSRVNHSRHSRARKTIDQGVQHLGVIFGIIRREVLPVEFNAIATIRGEPFLHIRNKRGKSLVRRSDSLEARFSFHTAHGNNQLHAVFLGHACKVLEVVGIVFVSKSNRTFCSRGDRHVVDVGHEIVADILGIELRILTPIRIEANHFVSGSLGHCSAHGKSQCNNFKVHLITSYPIESHG